MATPPVAQPTLNRLAAESSLYLRQHATNPVDWFPWGPEALARARELDRPIFLSIGYSACHWCHVMERESFENVNTAAIMNEHFVCIKVDREERPDLDQIYMTAHHLLNRGEGGGWPLSVFLMPNLSPFYAGTYYPPDERYAPQRPSFPRLLHAIWTAWQTRRDDLVQVGDNVAQALQGMTAGEPETGNLTPDLLDNAARSLKRMFDATNGGFGHAPKFPHPLEVKLLLRLAQRFPMPELLGMARLTLEKMARGGMYDQIGGGFHRYSVDAIWLVPHFEKMLYDNALLPPVYVEAYQQFGDPFFRQIACETLDYILREMTHPRGGIFSTQDADSEGHEGKFFVWTEAELEAILGAEDARFAQEIYSTSPQGNFEGKNILFRWRADADEARAQRMELAAFQAKLSAIKAKLYAERAKRVWPGRDEKILTAWNGLMIAAFAQAGAVFGESRYIAAAERAAEFVLAELRAKDGRLWRTWGETAGAKLTGYLEDYSYMLDALITLYEATFEPRWLIVARELAQAMQSHFADAANGGYFYTADDHETLIVRTKDLQDGSVPSGNAMAATGLLRLGKLTGDRALLSQAEATLRAYRGTLADQPMAAGQMLVALDFYLGSVDEIAVVGRRADPETLKVLQALRQPFRPLRVLAYHDPSSGPAPDAVPLLANKPMQQDRVTVYVCRDFACQAPLVGWEAIRQGLNLPGE
jgi:uncharacterized protein YyaL (SSP411 family)